MHVLVLDYTAIAVIGKMGPVKSVNHTSWMTVVTPSDRPKSVLNRCLIELFGDVFVLSCCPLDISHIVMCLIYLHSIRCFPSLRNVRRRCCYNIITTISDVISSEGIHETEKCV